MAQGLTLHSFECDKKVRKENSKKRPENLSFHLPLLSFLGQHLLHLFLSSQILKDFPSCTKSTWSYWDPFESHLFHHFWGLVLDLHLAVNELPTVATCSPLSYCLLLLLFPLSNQTMFFSLLNFSPSCPNLLYYWSGSQQACMLSSRRRNSSRESHLTQGKTGRTKDLTYAFLNKACRLWYTENKQM